MWNSWTTWENLSNEDTVSWEIIGNDDSVGYQLNFSKYAQTGMEVHIYLFTKFIFFCFYELKLYNQIKFPNGASSYIHPCFLATRELNNHRITRCRVTKHWDLTIDIYFSNAQA